MNKAYSRTYWQNKPSTETPIDADNLNNIEAGVDTIDDRVVALDASQSGLSDRVTTAESNITTLQNGKVDKVSGKGLSTNDYTTADKTKLAGISAQANQTTVTQVQESGDTSKEIARIGLDGETTSIYADDAKKVIESCYEEKTVTGNPITVKTISGSNAKALKVTMNPIQDLHGYPNPWAGGAGVNKLSAPTDGSNSNNGVTVSVVGGVYTLSGSATGRSANITFNLAEPYTIKDGDYLHLLNTVARDSSVITLQRQNGTAISAPGCTPINRIFNLSTSAGETIYSVRFYIANGTQTDFKMSLMIVNSSTATSYAPYSNICPISGRTEASVTRNSKNLFNNTAETTTTQGITLNVNADGTITGQNNATGTAVLYIATVSLPNGNYILNGCPSGGGSNTYKLDISKDGTFYTDNGSGVSFTVTDQNPYLVRLVVYSGNGNGKVFKPMVRPASIADTNYEPYQGETHTKEFGQTVYGGSDDFVNGKVVIDRKYVNAKDYTWSLSGNVIYHNFPDVYAEVTADTPTGRKPIVCNILDYTTSSIIGEGKIGFGGATNNKNICVNSTQFVDLTTWNTYIENNDVQIVYYLATPTTIQTSAENISLLKGNNVVSTDGDDMELSYQELPDITPLVQYVQTLEARIKALEEE